MKKKLLSPRTPFFAAILALVLLIVPLTGYQDANFEWAKLLGGGGRDYGASIVTDAEGNVYVTGPFYGSIDVNPNTHPTKAFNMTSHPLDFDDIYIVKLDRNGNLVQARQFGGEGRESGTSIARDTQGYIYVTGVFSGPKNVDFGKFPLGTKGNIDIFIIKLDPEKLGVIWAKRMGGTGRDLSWAVAVDPSTNDVCVTGYFQNTADFGPTTTLTGGGAFVCKLDSDGNFKWAKKMGQFHHASITSSGGCDPVVVDSFIVDQGRSVAIDALGNICVTGWFWGNADFDPGQEVSALLSAGGSDVFVVKLDSNGNFRWAKKMGGSGDDEGNSIAVDPLNNDICVASETFVTKLDTDGEEKWTTATGGLCMATDASGNIYVSGGGI
ncbi:MAG: SBBP repeat-containing protein, partial [Thermoanaerobaculia bacterium]|nr:SBBP repeat-containing protein [Thermoanaerobaculia bacterium]